MEIYINGEKRAYQEPMTVADLLESLSINPKAVVVERNLKIVSRGGFGEEQIENGDTIEIIRLVGGG